MIIYCEKCSCSLSRLVQEKSRPGRCFCFECETEARLIVVNARNQLGYDLGGSLVDLLLDNMTLKDSASARRMLQQLLLEYIR